MNLHGSHYLASSCLSISTAFYRFSFVNSNVGLGRRRKGVDRGEDQISKSRNLKGEVLHLISLDGKGDGWTPVGECLLITTWGCRKPVVCGSRDHHMLKYSFIPVSTF